MTGKVQLEMSAMAGQTPGWVPLENNIGKYNARATRQLVCHYCRDWRHDGGELIPAGSNCFVGECCSYHNKHCFDMFTED